MGFLSDLGSIFNCWTALGKNLTVGPPGQHHKLAKTTVHPSICVTFPDNDALRMIMTNQSENV